MSQFHWTLHQREALADSWYRALRGTSFTGLGEAEVRRRLTVLADQALRLLLREKFVPAEAQAIGADLVDLHFVQAVALGRTIELLGRTLLSGLPAEEIAEYQPRLALLLGEIAVGFFHRARATILREQEQIHAARYAMHQAWGVGTERDLHVEHGYCPRLTRLDTGAEYDNT